MKKIQKYIGLSFLVIFGWSCSEDELELTPTQENQASYYQLDEQVESAAWACYTGLNLIDKWGWSQISWGNFASDDASAGGETDNDNLGYHLADYYTCTPNDAGGQLSNMWKFTWQGIYKCNLLLTNMKPVKEKDFHRQAIAEAKVLKSLYYFYLARMWGGLPVFETTPQPVDPIKRASYEETLTAMEKWLKEAIAMTTVDGSAPALPTINSARVSIDAARVILGKVLIYHASLFNKSDKYTEAIPYLKAIADNPQYALMPNFADIFETDFNQESIFEINYTKVIGPGNTFFGNYEIKLYGPRSQDIVINETIGSGWGFNQPSQSLVDAFLAQNDLVRLRTTAISSDSLQKLHDIFKPGETIVWLNEITGYWDRKHITNNTRYSGSWQTYENNNILFRLADVYLLLAEAYNKTGDDANALTYVNKVRSRVGLPALASSGTQLLEDIKLERRLELALEGERYFDLVRWGDAEKYLGPIGYNSTSGPGTNTKGLFPMLQSEINRNTDANLIEQNPGY